MRLHAYRGCAVVGLVVACLWSSESQGWSIDTDQTSSKRFEKSTHALLADVAYEHFTRDSSYREFLRLHYGIEDGFDGFLREIYGLEDGSSSSFRFHFGLYGGSPAKGIPEYQAIDREFYDERFVRLLELPREILDDAHRLPPPFPILQNITQVETGNLLIMGAMVEDNEFPRTDHHFHDPVSNEGLNQWLPRLYRWTFGLWLEKGLFAEYHGGESAVNRAMGLGGASLSYPNNFFSLADAERYLYRSVVGEQAAERETAVGLHLLAFGHVLHLMQDMTQPAHVRNDSRVGHVLAKVPGIGGEIAPAGQVETLAEGDAARLLISGDLKASIGAGLAHSLPRSFLETFVQKHGHLLDPELLSDLNARIVATESQLPDFDGSHFEPADFFDREIELEKEYVQGSAFAGNHDPSAGNLGLAEFVNGEFFSDGTVGTTDDLFAPQYSSPAVTNLLPSSACRPLPFRRLDGSYDIVAGVPTFANLPEFSLFVSSPGVPHLLRCGYHSFTAEGKAEFRPESSDEAVLRDYYELLFALSIQYQREFMKSYFRPRLEVVPLSGNQFGLRNLSQQDFMAKLGAIELIYEVESSSSSQEPERHRVSVSSCVTDEAGDTFLLRAAEPGSGRGEQGEIACDMPGLYSGDPAPMPGGKMWVAIRGQHGTRGEIGAPADYDLSPWFYGRKDYVVMFAQVPLPRILFASGKLSDLEADDANHPVDIKSVEVNFHELEQAVEYVEPEFGNITGPIRDLLGVPEVDFFAPALRPGSSMLAVRTDQAFEPSTQGNGWTMGVALIDLRASPVENATRLSQNGILPGSSLILGDLDPRSVAWSKDGEALFYFGSEAGGGDVYLHRVLGLDLDMPPTQRDRATSSGNILVGQSFNNGSVDEECVVSSSTGMVAALSTDEVISASACSKRSLSPDSGIWVHEQSDEFLRHVLLDKDMSGDLVGAPSSYYDTVSLGIAECDGTGVCLSGHVDGGARSRQPSLSPDGSKVAFLRKLPGIPGRPEAGCDPNTSFSPEFAENQIWIARRSGVGAGEIELLIENPLADPSFYETPATPAESGIIEDLAWSPDGQWLAFITAQGCATGQPDKANLYVIRVPDPSSTELVRPLLVARGINAVVGHDATYTGFTWADGLHLPRGN